MSLVSTPESIEADEVRGSVFITIVEVFHRKDSYTKLYVDPRLLVLGDSLSLSTLERVSASGALVGFIYQGFSF